MLQDQYNQYTQQTMQTNLIVPVSTHSIGQHLILSNIQNLNINLNNQSKNSDKSLENLSTKHSIQTNCTNDISNNSQKGSIGLIEDKYEDKIVDQIQTQQFEIDLPLPGQQKQQNNSVKTLRHNICLIEDKMISHFKYTMKIDKYLRLICSIIKTIRAFNPKTKYTYTYKQLILARRIIRWESKYSTFVDLITQQDSKFMKFFKIIQLTGDLVDLIAFWLKLFHKKIPSSEQLIDKLQQLESNFYFVECLIWLGVYSYRYALLKKQSLSNRQQMQIKQKLIINLLKAVKYMMDVITSYNNSSLKALREINQKVAGILTFVSSIVGVYLLWR